MFDEVHVKKDLKARKFFPLSRKCYGVVFNTPKYINAPEITKIRRTSTKIIQKYSNSSSFSCNRDFSNVYITILIRPVN